MDTVQSYIYERDVRGNKQSYPQRDHHVVNHADGSETLVSFGRVSARRLPPYGSGVLPPDWQDADSKTVYYRADFLGVSTREIRRILQHPNQNRVTVSAVPLALPDAWLERHGPDSTEPYTVASHPMPFVGSDGTRYAVSEARSVPDDLRYRP